MSFKEFHEIVDAADGGNAYFLRGQAAQDLRDGEALRRLREALPEDCRLDVMWTSGGQVVVTGSGPGVDQCNTGATIAEAADKCREALG